ncbi:MAG: hypothetical protein HYZ38_28120 [Mycobacterium sp.]|nr:hypothetical protein [Mycobacterium sp.]
MTNFTGHDTVPTNLLPAKFLSGEFSACYRQAVGLVQTTGFCGKSRPNTPGSNAVSLTNQRSFTPISDLVQVSKQQWDRRPVPQG